MAKVEEIAEESVGRNFLEAIIDQDLAAGTHDGRVVTRFPPEPNGYLHVGHAKSICLNFGLAEQYGGQCHLRFDDTNPAKEDVEYTDAIKEDVNWLGFTWNENLFATSDYFPKLHDFAVQLIKMGKAYVCHLSADETKEYRGNLQTPGKNSPFRERSVEENLALFEQMKSGDLDDGTCVLRAKIDMSSPFMAMRDPSLYRIKKMTHHRTGDAWNIYPMYDFAHGLSDAIEGITHSICTLEFENNRPLYDWFIETVDTEYKPKQYEFARLNLTYTIISKRKLLKLIENGHVTGWDDPRMMTLRGMRRRGFTPASIRRFCDDIGVSKNNSWIGMERLEQCLRDDLNPIVPRRMAVLDPLKVVITNYEKDEEILMAKNHPGNEEFGLREIPFSGEIWIDRADFMEDAPKKFYRLAPGKEVRLRYSYVIRCDEVIKDTAGKIIQLNCSYDPETLGKNPEGRKVKGAIHWVSAKHAVSPKVRLYDRLFTKEKPDGDSYMDFINPDSLIELEHVYLEPSLLDLEPGLQVQFERTGYFVADIVDSKPGAPVFNRILAMKDGWAKLVAKGKTN